MPLLCITISIFISWYFIRLVWPQVDDFATNAIQENANFYGFAKETVDSLMLTLLPPTGHKYKQIPMDQNDLDPDMDIKVALLKYLLDALQENAGFKIPKVCSNQR